VLIKAGTGQTVFRRGGFSPALIALQLPYRREILRIEHGTLSVLSSDQV